MTPQTPVLKYAHQHKREPITTPHCSHAPRTFFERFGFLGTCILPAEVLDNTPLCDPETRQMQPSLRKRCSAYGLCFAHVLSLFADGLYWADVAANPHLVGAERVVLTEEHLTFALAWDERLQWRKPAHIRRLMQAHVRDMEPLCMRAAPGPAEHTPQVPLVAQELIAVTTEDLCEALIPHSELPQEPHCSTPSRWPSPLEVQQGLLRAMLRTLQKQMAHAQDAITAQTLQARCELLLHMQRWQQQTHQRVVHVDQGLYATQHRSVWYLTLGVPEGLLAESASAA